MKHEARWGGLFSHIPGSCSVWPVNLGDMVIYWGSRLNNGVRPCQYSLSGMHIREGGFRKIQKVHFVQLAHAVNGVQVCANGHRARGWSHGLN